MIDLKQQQLQILERIYDKKESTPAPKLNGILKTSLNFSEEQVNFAIGDFGLRLRAFASSINTDSVHPDLFSLFDGELASNEEGSFGRESSDILNLSCYAMDRCFSKFVLDILKKTVSKHKQYSAISKTIDDPKENLLHVRFVPLRSDRDKIRSRKKMQSVNQNFVSRLWEMESNDFSNYMRFVNVYEKDIAEAEIRFKHFNYLGLLMMSDEIKKSIVAMNQKCAESQYYGFNKISLVSASIILAKKSGYEFGFINGIKKIHVETDFFKHRFFADKWSLIDDSKVPALELTPRAYTNQEFDDLLSPEVLDIINYLEEFPDAEGFTLFDHYRVLVAGNNFFSSICKSIELDRQLVKSEEIPAILLGERDGDCYFICYI